MNVVKTGLRSGRQGAEWLLLAALMPAGVMVGAEVQSVVVPAKAADLDFTVETRDRPHIRELHRALRQHGFAVGIR